MSTVKVNTVDKRTGGTLTLGGCGTTVTLGAGATQSGFGRTGTVDWCTTAKTAPFTGVSGNGYFVNTTSGVVTVTLPATPSAGDIISIADYASTFQTNNLTLCNNGSLINGVCAIASLSTQGQSITLVYVDGTRGWKNTMDSTSNVSGAAYITATGGTETTCGDYKIHTFTSSGTFTVSELGIPANNNVDYLVVAAGGGGGNDVGGGGGAGGYRESSGAASGCYSRSPLGACVAALPVTATAYPITIGAGGAGTPAPTNPGPGGASGTDSIFSTITSTGGGGAGSINTNPNAYGANGGSGGGGARFGTPCGSSPGGTGNTPPVSPPQGQNGGPAGPVCGHGGGGGGATAVGTSGSPTPCQIGAGGDGGGTAINPATGTPGPSPTLKYYGGGGGGGVRYPISPAGVGPGGVGGGGPSTVNSGVDGTANTGGGGGGRGSGNSPPPVFKGGDGGSGIVIIRYKYQ
jgi:hypothetical protein